MLTIEELAAGRRRSRSGPTLVLPEEQRSDMLRSLASGVGQGIEALGLVLDFPGAVTRGILAGDPLSGFKWNFDDRVSGSELLDAYGLKVPDKILGSKALGSTAKFLTGFGAEVALDPLWLGKFGSSSASLAGKVLAKTPYADDATRLYARKIIDEPLQRARSRQEFLSMPNPVAAEQEFIRRRATSTRGGTAVVDALERNNIPLTQGMREVAPPVGPRVARSNLTPEDILRLTPDSDKTKVLSDIETAAKSFGTTYDQIKSMPLGGLLTVGARGFEKTFNPQWGQKYLDALDSLTNSIKYSSPIVKAASLFQKGVDQAPTLQGQLQALRRGQVSKPIVENMRVRISRHVAVANAANKAFMENDAAKQLLKVNDLLTPDGTAALKRIVEDVPTEADQQLLALVPELQTWKDSWSDIRDEILTVKQKAGIDVEELSDPFGVSFSPRIPEEADFSDLARRPRGQTMLYGTEEASELSRTVQTPGGSMDVTEMSQDPVAQQFALDLGTGQGKTTKEQIQWVRDWLAKKYGGLRYVKEAGAYKFLTPDRLPSQALREAGEDVFISPKQLGKVAGLLRRYDPQYFQGLPANRQVPLFSAAPPIAQARYMESTARSLGNAEFVYETLADSSVQQRANTIRGGGYRSLDRVLDDVTKQLGLARRAEKVADDVTGELIDGPIGPASEVVDNLKDRLLRVVSQSQPGFTKDSINLADFSVPETVANALTERISSFVSPSRKRDVANFLDSFTALFKNTVLARPARFTRDYLSNALSVYFETGNAAATSRGFWYASKVLAGDYDAALPYLRKLDRYKNLTSDREILDQVAADTSRTQLLGGLASNDLLKRNSTMALSEYYPGASPRTIMGPLGQMVADFTPTAERGIGDIARDVGRIRGVGFFGKAPTETANPLFKASESIGDTVDAVGRLGGFFALLESGNSVEQAAKRMKRALVDYSSLTNFERDRLVKFWFPWWAYNSRIGAYVAQSLYNDPGGRYAQTVRFFNDLQGTNEDGYVPTSIRQNIGLNLTPLLGEPSPGVETFLTNFDVPGFDLAGTYQPAPGSLLPDVQGTARNVALQLSPLLRGFTELASGRDTFTGRPLDEADTTAQRLYQYFAGPGAQLSGPTKVLASNFPPFQLLEPFLRPATDTRLEPTDRLLKFLVNYTAPVRVQNVDAGYRLSDQIRSLEPSLRGIMRTSTRQYVPADQKEYLSPEEMLRVNLYQDLQNQRAYNNKMNPRN